MSMNFAESLGFGWEVFARRPGRWLLIVVALGLAQFVLHALLAALLPQAVSAPLGIVLSGLFEAGLLNAARVAVSGREPSLDDALRPWTNRQADYLVVALAAKAGILIGVVGIFVSMFFCFFAPLLVAEGESWKDALRHSKQLMIAQPWRAIGWMLALVVFNFVGAMFLGVGLLITCPMTAVAVVKLRERAAAQPTGALAEGFR